MRGIKGTNCREIKICKKCGNEFLKFPWVNQKFCSLLCYHRDLIGRASKKKGKGKIYQSEICGCGQHKDPRAFTCRKCMGKRVSERQWGNKNPMWNGGTSYLPYPPSFNKQLKETIRVRDNFTCKGCGIPELEFNKCLMVHHIDYNKKNMDKTNLICLCRRCHNQSTLRRKEWQQKLSKKMQLMQI